MTATPDVPPRVSVVILNFNGERIIRHCLESVLAQTVTDLQIIVVDNGSTDGSLAVLQEYLPNQKLSVVRSTRNRGVAGGRNMGFQHARGRIVAFLDNDAVADPAWLAQIEQAIDEDPLVGGVSSVVFDGKRRSLILASGGTMNRRGQGRDFCLFTAWPSATVPTRVLWPTGCGMAFRADVLGRIMPLDDALLKWYDDVELGIRTWALGYCVTVAPTAHVFHEQGYSDQFLPERIALAEKARVRTVLKYFPLRYLLGWALHEWMLLFKMRFPGARTAPFRVLAWNLLHLPSTLSLRRRFDTATVPWAELLSSGWWWADVPSNRDRCDLAPDGSEARL